MNKKNNTIIIEMKNSPSISTSVYWPRNPYVILSALLLLLTAFQQGMLYNYIKMGTNSY
jgi:hypothetical protein